MKNLSLAFAAAAMVVTSAAMPAMSAPLMPQAIAKPAMAEPVAGVEQVQYRPGYRPGYGPGPRRGYWSSGGSHYYNGHRGYNYYRPGYRQYNGWWFPAGAFAAGAILGGVIASQPGPTYAAPAGGHVQWCASRYRSYRASDNTFQPYSGPRQQCVSPY